jgi:negative regulator of replication initiation
MRVGPSVIAAFLLAAAGCSGRPDTSLERLTESRRLASDVLVQLARAADATNRAVMADTDDESAASAREAEQAADAIQKDVDALRPMLQALQYTKEAGVLEEFVRRFAQYRELDRGMLALAVENTNLKAQRLSFGPASEAADAFRAALDALTAPAGESGWHARALVASAVEAIREIQVLQAPHIAEANDGAMTKMETRMAASEALARRHMQSLASLLPADAKPRLAAAAAALDRFMTVNAELVALSRRNTNVRSLALALGQKRMLTAACEESAQALQDALATRGFTATR